MLTTDQEYIKNKLVYLNNCIYWIKEYQEGRTNFQRLQQTFSAIEEHISEMKQKIKEEKR